MTTWTSDELNRIGKAEELEIQSLRRDGTLRNPDYFFNQIRSDYRISLVE